MTHSHLGTRLKQFHWAEIGQSQSASISAYFYMSKSDIQFNYDVIAGHVLAYFQNKWSTRCHSHCLNCEHKFEYIFTYLSHNDMCDDNVVSLNRFIEDFRKRNGIVWHSFVLFFLFLSLTRFFFGWHNSSWMNRSWYSFFVILFYHFIYQTHIPLSHFHLRYCFRWAFRNVFCVCVSCPCKECDERACFQYIRQEKIVVKIPRLFGKIPLFFGLLDDKIENII